MEPLKILYWSRVGFGIIAAFVCTLLTLSNFLSGLAFGILFYVLTYYILKRRFASVVEKASKLFMMGIGAYFLSWLVSWTIFYTLAIEFDFIPRPI